MAKINLNIAKIGLKNLLKIIHQLIPQIHAEEEVQANLHYIHSVNLEKWGILLKNLKPINMNHWMKLNKK